ncbi:MAG: N-acetylmuramate alpha-1-phosphate uridylyltransferase MurU [Pseudomonadota bacterium]
MRAIILAAGRGERMRPLTDSVPKPLLRVGKTTLLERHLDRLARAGVTDVMINVSWLAQTIITAIGSGDRYGVKVAYSHEPPGALETLGAVRQVLPWLGEEPFWLVNGDVFSDFDFAAQRPDADYSLLANIVLVPNPPHKPMGDFACVEGLATRPTDSERDYTYAGIGWYRPDLFAAVATGRAPLGPLLFNTAAAGQLGATVHNGRWDDVGTPQRLDTLRRWLDTSTPP